MIYLILGVLFVLFIHFQNKADTAEIVDERDRKVEKVVRINGVYCTEKEFTRARLKERKAKYPLCSTKQVKKDSKWLFDSYSSKYY